MFIDYLRSNCADIYIDEAFIYEHYHIISRRHEKALIDMQFLFEVSLSTLWNSPSKEFAGSQFLFLREEG